MATFKVNFTKVDNWANIYVNGLCVFSNATNAVNGALSVDVTRYLVSGRNTVKVDGVNYSPWATANPFEFDYTITADSTVIANISQKSNVATPTTGASYVGASSSLEIVI